MEKVAHQFRKIASRIDASSSPSLSKVSASLRHILATLSYYDSAEGILVDAKRAKKEVLDHSADWEEFLADNGQKDTYEAQKILDWLGY